MSSRIKIAVSCVFCPCVAMKNIKRGTLILCEKPQCIAMGQPWTKEWIQTVVSSFNQMNIANQEKYLKLHNRFSDFEALNDLQKKAFLDRKAKIGDVFDFDQHTKITEGAGKGKTIELLPRYHAILI